MPAGRPTKYKPEFCAQAKKLCELGATDIELADFFEVSEVTLNAWKKRYPEFIKSLKTGKSDADERVERSLYHKAIGYSHDSEKVFQHQGSVVRAPFREHVPPDTTAAIFWLKNRRPAEWRDRKEVDLGVQDSLADLLREIDGNSTGGPGFTRVDEEQAMAPEQPLSDC